MPAGKLIMMGKRKNEDDRDVVDSRIKKQRRRKRSRSEPRYANNPQKREALKKLFGRYCTLKDNLEYIHDSDDSDNESLEGAENEDALMDEVPVNMDPEQLGFLLCAQETLRFLQERGLTLGHPMLARLRRHFIRGINHIAIA